MKPTGVKIVVERQDGQITTWHDVLDRRVESIILNVIKQKGWENGKVIEAYIEFDVNGYYKVHLDCARLTKVLQIMGYKSNMNALCNTEWFSMKNNPPKGEDLCIMVYYEEEDSSLHLFTSMTYSLGKLLDDDFNEVDIKDNMIWSYWPDPVFK